MGACLGTQARVHDEQTAADFDAPQKIIWVANTAMRDAYVRVRDTAFVGLCEEIKIVPSGTKREFRFYGNFAVVRYGFYDDQKPFALPGGGVPQDILHDNITMYDRMFMHVSDDSYSTYSTIRSWRDTVFRNLHM